MSSKTIILLLTGFALLGYSVQRPEIPENLDVQFTTFRVSGTDLPLSLLTQPLNDDAALFARLAGMVQDGTAELIAHQQATIPVGQDVQLGAMKELPYPTEYFPVPQTSWLMPQSFEYKNCGTQTTIGLGEAPDQSSPTALTGNLSLERIRGDELSGWPVSLPGTNAEGILNHPKFLTEKSSLPFRAADGIPHLISIVTEAGETTDGPQRYLISFARVARQQGKNTPLATPGSRLRFHALTFRLDALTGRALLRDSPAGNASTLLTSLLSATREGTATISHQGALLVDTTQPRQGDPPHADPFAQPRDTTPFHLISISAESEAIEEFPFPTEFSDDLMPQSFEYKNLGRTFSVRVKRARETSGTLVQISLSHWHKPRMTSLPEAPGPQVRQVYQPCFPSIFLQTTLKTQAGGVYCLGAITLPDYFHQDTSTPRLMEISLLQVVGETTASAPTDPTLTEWETELISLTAADAARLNVLQNTPAEAAALLDESLEAGAAHSLTFCRIAGRDSFPCSIKVLVEDIIPNKSIRTKDGLLRLNEFEYHNLGTSLENIPAAAGKSASLRFAHNIAGLARPSNEILTRIADSDGVVPQPSRHDWETTLPQPAAELVIGPAEAVRVPTGHPEEGRWQVSVTRRR